MAVYSRQSPNAFKTARRNISSIVTRKCIQKREYCPIQTDATRTAVKDNPGKDATCRQSEAISVLYGLFVDPEPWLHQIVSLLWVVTVSLTCPVLRTGQYSTPLCCVLFRMKARNTLSTCGIDFLGPIWQSKGSLGSVCTGSYTFGCGRISSYCDWPHRSGESISNFQKSREPYRVRR